MLLVSMLSKAKLSVGSLHNFDLSVIVFRTILELGENQWLLIWTLLNVARIASLLMKSIGQYSTTFADFALWNYLEKPKAKHEKAIS